MYNSYNPYGSFNPNQNAYASYQQQLAQLQAQYPGLSPNGGYSNPQQAAQPQNFQPQQIFLQPNGSLFSIDNVEQLSNVPVTEGSISCVIFPNANMMYLKSMQQGKPVLLTYSLSSTEAVKANDPKEVMDKATPVVVDDFRETATKQINLLGDTNLKLWQEVEGLKKKLSDIYKQLGVEDNGS